MYDCSKDVQAHHDEKVTLPKAEQDEFLQAHSRLIRCNELNTGQLTIMSEVKGHG